MRGVQYRNRSDRNFISYDSRLYDRYDFYWIYIYVYDRNFLCYNRFSEIMEEDIKDVTTNILDVQVKLLTIFSDKTILVSLSRFKALKLLYDIVVDTSVMFLHRNGYPQKKSIETNSIIFNSIIFIGSIDTTWTVGAVLEKRLQLLLFIHSRSVI